MKTILVADDVGYSRLLFEKALSKKGYKVITVANGKETLEYIQQNVLDLVIIDINMPALSGLEVIKVSRGLHKKLHFIVVTAVIDKKVRKELEDLGIQAFFRKPVDINKLCATVTEILSPRQRLLIVDDDKAVRELYTDFFSKQGYWVCAVSDGLTAVKQTLYNPFDLILLDLNLPGLDGIEVMRTLRNQAQKCPIIIITGYGKLVTSADLENFNISYLVEKPVDLKTLHNLVRSCIGQYFVKRRGKISLLTLQGKIANAELLRHYALEELDRKQHLAISFLDCQAINKEIEKELEYLAAKYKDTELCFGLVINPQQHKTLFSGRTFINQFPLFFEEETAFKRLLIQEPSMDVLDYFYKKLAQEQQKEEEEASKVKKETRLEKEAKEIEPISSEEKKNPSQERPENQTTHPPSQKKNLLEQEYAIQDSTGLWDDIEERNNTPNTE